MEYKAGDFTSGKMSEIFKQCYMKDLAIINHKQFGRAYMVPEDIVRVISVGMMLDDSCFLFYVSDGCIDDDTKQNFMKKTVGEQLDIAVEYFGCDEKDWLTVLSLVVSESRISSKAFTSSAVDVLCSVGGILNLKAVLHAGAFGFYGMSDEQFDMLKGLDNGQECVVKRGSLPGYPAYIEICEESREGVLGFAGRQIQILADVTPSLWS